MNQASTTILVTGATGAQGGAVVHALHAAGRAARALVRDPASETARALVDAGIPLAVGDLEDEASLDAAFDGVSALFSVQPAPFLDPDSERRQACNLVSAARRAGVAQCVHTSVSATGWRTSYPDVDAGSSANYWDSKEHVENMVRNAGFDTFTILKPAFMMDNFIAPKAQIMFPHLPGGEILTAVQPDAVLATVSKSDIAAAASAAFADPKRFANEEIELAGDATTTPEIAALISNATERSVVARTLTQDEVDARQGAALWLETQLWLNQVGYLARPDDMRVYGLTPTSFETWAAANADQLRAATTPV